MALNDLTQERLAEIDRELLEEGYDLEGKVTYYDKAYDIARTSILEELKLDDARSKILSDYMGYKSYGYWKNDDPLNPGFTCYAEELVRYVDLFGKEDALETLEKVKSFARTIRERYIQAVENDSRSGPFRDSFCNPLANLEFMLDNYVIPFLKSGSKKVWLGNDLKTVISMRRERLMTATEAEKTVLNEKIATAEDLLKKYF